MFRILRYTTQTKILRLFQLSNVPRYSEYTYQIILNESLILLESWPFLSRGLRNLVNLIIYNRTNAHDAVRSGNVLSNTRTFH